MDEKTNEPILELNTAEMLCVAGGGFLSWLTGVLQSGSSTSTPANSGELGVRG